MTEQGEQECGWRDKLVSGVNHDAGTVALSALRTALLGSVKDATTAMLFRNTPERDADWFRGRASLAREIFDVLKPQEARNG